MLFFLAKGAEDLVTKIFNFQSKSRPTVAQSAAVGAALAGSAMAIAKKALGNEGNYYNVFKKWLPKDDETIETDKTNIGELFYDQKANDILNKALEDIKKNIKTSIPSSWDGNFIYRNIRGLLENDKY